MKLWNHIKDFLRVGAEVLLILFVIGIVYGLLTDCPSTAGVYVDCGFPWSR